MKSSKKSTIISSVNVLIKSTNGIQSRMYNGLNVLYNSMVKWAFNKTWNKNVATPFVLNYISFT